MPAFQRRARSDVQPQSEAVRGGERGPGLGNGFVASLLNRGGQGHDEEREALGDKLELLHRAHGQISTEDTALLVAHTRLGVRLDQLSVQVGDGRVSQLEEAVDQLDAAMGQLVVATRTVIQLRAAEGTERTVPDDVSSLYVNGATRGLTDSMGEAQKLADIRGSDVGLVHNESVNRWADYAETDDQRDELGKGGSTNSEESQVLAAEIERLMGSGQRVDIVGHSQGLLFGAEAMHQLGEDEDKRGDLDDNVHMTGLGSAVDASKGQLPEWYDNARFIDEREDVVARLFGGRGTPDQDNFEGMVNQSEEGGIENLVFDDSRFEGMFGISLGGHDSDTYFDNEDSRSALAANPFEQTAP